MHCGKLEVIRHIVCIASSRALKNPRVKSETISMMFGKKKKKHTPRKPPTLTTKNKLAL